MVGTETVLGTVASVARQSAGQQLTETVATLAIEAAGQQATLETTVATEAASDG